MPPDAINGKKYELLIEQIQSTESSGEKLNLLSTMVFMIGTNDLSSIEKCLNEHRNASEGRDKELKKVISSVKKQMQKVLIILAFLCGIVVVLNPKIESFVTKLLSLLF